ncbi:MAG: DUF748 domain-containing protein [Alphaproteobacteria bacterium]|nr:DUF748 domain-containing protein [Alphaproteobacteria bacterium]
MVDRAATPDTTPEGASSKRGRRGLWWSGGIILVIAVLCAAIFIGPRFAARYIVADELDKLGIAHEGVGTIIVDMWNQEVLFGPVSVRKADAKPGQIKKFGLKLRLWNLLSRRAVVDSIIIEGVDIRVTRSAKGKISLNGVLAQIPADDPNAETKADPEDERWHAALEKLELRDSKLTFIQAGKGEAIIDVERLSLNGFRTWEPNNPGKFNLVGRINDIGIRAQGEARPFANRITVAMKAGISKAAIEKIEKFTGQLGFTRRAGEMSGKFGINAALFDDGRVETSIKGGIDVSGVDIERIEKESIAASSLRTEFDLKVGLSSDQKQTVAGNISVNVSKLRAAAKDKPPISAGNLSVSLVGLKAATGPGNTIKIDVVPTVKVQDVEIVEPQKLNVDAVTLALSALNISGAQDSMSVKAAGTANIAGTKGKITDRHAIDATIGNLSVDIKSLDATLSGKEPAWQTKMAIAVDKTALSVDGGKLMMTKIQKVAVNSLSADQKLHFQVGNLFVSGLQVDATEKILNIGEDASSAGVSKGVKSTPSPQATSPAPKIKIEQFKLTDKARIGFKDSSVLPAIETKVGIETLEISSIDSGDPARRSDLRFSAKLNEFTGIDVSGWATPFGAKPDFDLKAKLGGLELPRFSSYAAKLLGLNLESGQLNVTASGKSKAAALDSSIKINMKDLKFTPLSAEAEKKLSGQVGMPVQTAVGLLQDSNKAINLTIPVGGTVAKPAFDLSDAIGQAIGGALKSLFPPTAFAAMLSSAGNSGVTFKPIPFAAGASKLGPEAVKYAASLAELLDKRPKLGVRVCGRTTADDLAHFASQEFKQRVAASKNKKPALGKPAIKPQLFPLEGAALRKAALPSLSKLAVARTRAIRTYLLKQGKSVRGRVSECRSAFDPKDKGVPRVNVSL